MDDWITKFMSVTEGGFSPRRFRLWTAIGIIAGVLERRVFTVTKGGDTYTNLFTTLAGSSGSGKSQSLEYARDLWVNTQGLRLAPDDVTTASFYDALAACTKNSMNGTGMSINTPMTVLSRELGNFLPKYDMGFLSNLSDLYDNPPKFDSARRTSISVDIDKPTVNMLIAATPSYLGDILPEAAWGQGFTSRFIFIYDFLELDSNQDIFVPKGNVKVAELRDPLNLMFDLHGEVTWSEPARKEMNAWVNAGQPPVPEHGRLKEYCTRRRIHVLKLAMISAISHTLELYVTLEDFERALDWLLDAETAMPNVFRAMHQKSDMQLVEDLWFHVYTIYSAISRDARKPVPAQELWKFLGERTTSERIPRIIELAEKSGALIKDKYDDAYLPKPLNNRTEV